MIFCNADKGFSKLGYKKVHESGVYVSYEGELNQFGYVHCIDIGHKGDGRHIISSYEKGLNSEGFNNSVGMTEPEIRCALKKMREKKWRYGKSD